MSHPLILALFGAPADAANAARELRTFGLPPERVSIVARSHDEEGELARASGASPGSEIEDSRPASRLGELSGHFFAAMALVMPGIGPIVADGPLAAGLGEAAGHVAGGIARTLEHAGLARADADAWQARIEQGAILVGAHVSEAQADDVTMMLTRRGALQVTRATWRDADAS